MNFFEKNAGRIVYILGAIIALGIYFFVTKNNPSPELQRVLLAEHFALTAVAFIYLMVLLNPLLAIFPNFPGKDIYLKARHPLGLTGLFFGLLHASIAFFGLLGGFRGLPFLPPKYELAITLSSLALLIFIILGISTFFFKKFRLSRWSYGLGYVGDVFIVVHALLIGTHFADWSGTVAKIYGFALLILLALEAARLGIAAREALKS